MSDQLGIDSFIATELSSVAGNLALKTSKFLLKEAGKHDYTEEELTALKKKVEKYIHSELKNTLDDVIKTLEDTFKISMEKSRRWDRRVRDLARLTTAKVLNKAARVKKPIISTR